MRIPWYLVVNKSLNYDILGVVHRWNEIESSLISIWRSKRARSKIYIPSQARTGSTYHNDFDRIHYCRERPSVWLSLWKIMALIRDPGFG